MPSDVDPDGLLEFSVVFTDRSLNHMSARFCAAMRGISAGLKEAYGADHIAVVPGGGTYAMEAVARALGRGRGLVIRNGWFSFRWSQIVESFGASELAVLKARRTGNAPDAPFSPVPAAQAAQAIRDERPEVVFAPHVETASGIILPDAYLAEMATAAHEVGALFVLDCVASGAVWVDMRALGIDVLISAPQKGWSSTPAAGLVMMNDAALARVQAAEVTSFALDLAKWHSIMAAYEAGGHAYHATLPTDGLMMLHAAMEETREFGFEQARQAQWRLGDGVRAMLAERGIASVAAAGFGAPGVVVSYTGRPEVQNGTAFAAAGLQTAAGVPLRCDEPEGFSTFRIGLFGLDKLKDVEGTLAVLSGAVDKVFV